MGNAGLNIRLLIQVYQSVCAIIKESNYMDEFLFVEYCTFSNMLFFVSPVWSLAINCKGLSWVHVPNIMLDGLKVIRSRVGFVLRADKNLKSN